jgi:hypothetical protein
MLCGDSLTAGITSINSAIHSAPIQIPDGLLFIPTETYAGVVDWK